MFPAWSVRLVLALVLAVLPLQGFAETIHVVLCQPQGQAHAEPAAPRDHDGHIHSGDGHAHDDHAAGHASTSHAAGADDVAASSGAASDGHAAHFCCDIVVAALPSVALALAQPEFPRLQAAREAFHYSTFLAYPQRPPLV